ncbi:BQ2448_6564 [Microbotryum intermedium]|uniref:BQ2448_6564 protein n=1 Tax=Microbotryum intermedium TaxID=269621 RepID=A0A238FK19_9BASI|nr:BQ2448_6564 [Microbotryum intermedium]
MPTKPPPARSASTPPLSIYLCSLRDGLETTNSRLSLSVPKPPNGLFKPGDTLHPIVNLHKCSTEYTSLSLTLVVTTYALIYGKDRWQRGQIAAAMLGNATAGGPAITTVEQVPLFTLEVPWISPNTAGATAAARSEKDTKRSSKGSADPLRGGMYEIVLPHPQAGDTLPTMRRKDEGLSVPNRLGVSWILHLRGKRHGFFKLDDHLQIELPVGFPLVPPIPDSLPDSEWLTATASKDPLHKGPQGGGATSLQAKHLHCRQLFIQPPSRITTRIPFHLQCSPSDPSTLSLFTPSPRLSLTLNQRAFTQPILDKNLGQPMHWSGIAISASREVPKFIEPEKGKGFWEWKGEVDVPEDCVTVESEGLKVKVWYFITAQFTSDRIMEHSLSVTVPVFLPSFPRSLALEEMDHDGMEPGPSDSTSTGQEELPSYTPS